MESCRLGSESEMCRKARIGIAGVAIAIMLGASPTRAGDIYLGKMSKTLDNWWNTLDSVCRGMPGNSDASNLACDQRLQLDVLLKKMGCWNNYPATGPKDTSYWKCRR